MPCQLPDRDGPNRDREKLKASLLLGVGLDGDDGHTRVTTGRDFHLVGGSEETHERMTETAIKLNEKLDQRGRRLADVQGKELADMVREAAEDTRS